jgi:PAS domain S-box-containing protein
VVIAVVTMPEDKKTVLKKVIRKIHDGEDPEAVKREFAQALRGATAADISSAEDELIRDGMPREEIHKLCEVHLAVFRVNLEQQRPIAPEGHPIHLLMEEHKILLNAAEKLASMSRSLVQGTRSLDNEPAERIHHLVRYFKESANHYLREENVLFPHLERHGITGPPKVMWTEHDQIRSTEKALFDAVSEDRSTLAKNIKKIEQAASGLSELLSNHYYKENNVLFPTALKIFAPDEWQEVRAGFDEVGYCFFSPKWEPVASEFHAVGEKAKVLDGEVVLESGTLGVEVLQTMLNTLPVDITFVDDQDRVKYFSESPERIFVRSRAIVGRSVQNCHPQKSVHIVNKILDDFRDNKRNVAEFWINLKGRMVLIRYFAVRSKSGKYLGCLEVSQDITDIQRLQGEKRLLDDTP